MNRRHFFAGLIAISRRASLSAIGHHAMVWQLRCRPNVVFNDTLAYKLSSHPRTTKNARAKKTMAANPSGPLKAAADGCGLLSSSHSEMAANPSGPLDAEAGGCGLLSSSHSEIAKAVAGSSPAAMPISNESSYSLMANPRAGRINLRKNKGWQCNCHPNMYPTTAPSFHV